MPLETVLTMVITIGAVWGGLTVVLITAMKKEQQKQGQ